MQILILLMRSHLTILIFTARSKVGDWHYLVFADSVTIADAQLADVHGKVEFSSLNHGTFAAGTVDALKMAEQSPQLQGKTVELRVLFISALHVVAVWLHADSEDVLIPIEPTPTVCRLC